MKQHYRAYFEEPYRRTLCGVEDGNEAQLRQKNLLSNEAELLWEIETSTSEEACSIFNLRNDFGAYYPEGDPAPCPECGTIFYPDSYGECWRCGLKCCCPAHYAEAQEAAKDEPPKPPILSITSGIGRHCYRAYQLPQGDIRLYRADIGVTLDPQDPLSQQADGMLNLEFEVSSHNGARRSYQVASEAFCRKNGQLPETATLVWEVHVDTLEEALIIYQLRMGLPPFEPPEHSERCPQCDAVYYRECSGECWRCGPVRLLPNVA